MKIMLLGDTHGNVRHTVKCVETAAAEGVSRIIQLGDFGFYWRGEDRTRPLRQALADAEIDLAFLPGNHEDWERLSRLDRLGGDWGRITSRLTYLGRVNAFEWSGVRFLTVGGAISIDKSSRVPGYTWFPDEAITDEDVFRALDYPTPHVVLSHDSPNNPVLQAYLESESERWGLPYKTERASTQNREQLDHVLRHHRPKLWFHGHYHHRYVGKVDGTTIHGLARDGNRPSCWQILELNELADAS